MDDREKKYSQRNKVERRTQRNTVLRIPPSAVELFRVLLLLFDASNVSKMLNRKTGTRSNDTKEMVRRECIGVVGCV